MQNNEIPCLKLPLFLLEDIYSHLTISDKMVYLLYFNALDISFRNERKNDIGYYTTINRRKICNIVNVKNNAIRISIRKLESQKLVKDIVSNHQYMPNKTYLYAHEWATEYTK